MTYKELTLTLLASFLIALPTISSQTSTPIRIVAIGTVLPMDTPVVHWCADEPMASCSIIPTRLGGATYEAELAQRMIRLYFPRRLDGTTVDIVLFSAGDVVYLTTAQIAAITRGVEEGVGAIADVGGTSVISQSIESWIASGIGIIFPNDVAAVRAGTYGQVTPGYPGYFLSGVPYTIEVREDVPRNPFAPFVSVGIEKVHGYAGRNMIAKEGSTILASVKGDYGFLRYQTPFSLTWRYENGRTLTVCEWFGHPFWSEYGTLIQQCENAHAAELFVNLLLYVTDRPLFENIVEIHAIKENIKEYRIRRGNLLSVIEFAATFGANMAPIEDDLDRIAEARASADAFYMEGDYDRASTLLESAVLDLQSSFDRAIDQKNRALTSVYISEWLAVTATLVISGSIVYEVMVKRRAFREVATTRST